MNCKYYIQNENTLIKIDFENNVFETRNIDEHTLECIYDKMDVIDATEYFNMLQNICKIPFKEIDENKYMNLSHKFDDLFQDCCVIKNIKIQYADKIKNYLNNF